MTSCIGCLADSALLLPGNFPWEHAQDSDVYYNEYVQWLRHYQMQRRYKLPSQWYKFSTRLMRIFRKMLGKHGGAEEESAGEQVGACVCLDPDPLQRCEITEISKYYDDRWLNDQFQSHRRSSNEDEGVEEDFSSSGSGAECQAMNANGISHAEFEELAQMMKNSLTGFDNLLGNDKVKPAATIAKTCC